MRPVRDPEGAELAHLRQACQMEGKTILEVGCGDGKVTTQYSNFPRYIFGIDPDMADLCTAREKILSSNTNFIQATGERMPLPSQTCDVAFFASSL